YVSHRSRVSHKLLNHNLERYRLKGLSDLRAGRKLDNGIPPLDPGKFYGRLSQGKEIRAESGHRNGPSERFVCPGVRIIAQRFLYLIKYVTLQVGKVETATGPPYHTCDNRNGKN